MEQNLFTTGMDSKHTEVVVLNKGKEQVQEVRGANLCFQSPKAEQEITVSDACLDVISLHTISLLHHNRNVRALISSIQESESSKSKRFIIPEAPQIPELPECILKHRRPGDLASRKEIKENRDFEEFRSSNVPVLSHNVAWKILKKSVAVICAHAGYDTTSDVILDTLTDIVQDYFNRVCSVLRKNTDKRAFMGHMGFMDVLEQTFHDIGLGSMTMLHYFYQSRVVDYHEHALKSCEALMKEYKKLKLLKECEKDEMSTPSQDEKIKESTCNQPFTNEDDACTSDDSTVMDPSNMFKDEEDTQLTIHSFGMEEDILMSSATNSDVDDEADTDQNHHGVYLTKSSQKRKKRKT